MPERRDVMVRDLALDLHNYRSLPQPDEIHAVQAMIAAKSERFWALFDSILDDGYLPTENIIVLETDSGLVVREGNRRIAVMKLIHGLIPHHTISMPPDRMKRLQHVPDAWRRKNTSVPCAVYPISEEQTVDRIVALIHGKGEAAGRTDWTAVARARHNRDAAGRPEPALDLLEKYLRSARNITADEREQWAADFPVTVLEEAMKRLAPRLGAANGPDLSRKYPEIHHRDVLDAIIRAIGLGDIGFQHVRRKGFGDDYGLPQEDSGFGTGSTSSDGTRQGTEAGGHTKGNAGSANEQKGASKKSPARATNDPRAVKQALRRFTPRGPNREKVVTLRDEAQKLDIRKTPLAFCFLLRSMFEISAKAYCDEHANEPGAPQYTKKNGEPRKLKDVLADIAQHLTSGDKDKQMVKELTGAKVELGRPESVLSVTSMNQLVHNSTFTTTAEHISAVFMNVFPLLKAMNS